MALRGQRSNLGNTTSLVQSDDTGRIYVSDFRGTSLILASDGERKSLLWGTDSLMKMTKHGICIRKHVNNSSKLVKRFKIQVFK